MSNYSTDAIPPDKRDALRDSMAASFAEDLGLTSDEWSYVTTYLSRLDTPRSDSDGKSSRYECFGANYDPDDSILDMLWTQYITAVDKTDIEIFLVAKNEFTLEIDKFKLLDLKTVPIEQHPQMLAAIAKEFNDLIAIGVFADVECPADRKAISSRIVLKVKTHADGSFDKFKARHVAKGFLQKLGFDFYSTFSPMASLTSIRVIFAIAVHLKLPIFHSDVPQAFIKALLKENIWIQLPPGILFRDKNGRAHKVVKLLRALYGLRQSPAEFNKELNRFL